MGSAINEVLQMKLKQLRATTAILQKKVNEPFGQPNNFGTYLFSKEECKVADIKSGIESYKRSISDEL